MASTESCRCRRPRAVEDWRFGDTGITNEIVEGRRLSSYIMPIPASKVRGKQLELETQWTRDPTGRGDVFARAETRGNVARNALDDLGRWDRF
jgi:hypothetical protein